MLNIIDTIIAPVLKPIQIDRTVVKFRKVIKKIMRQPVRIQNITVSNRIAKMQHVVNDANQVGVYTKVTVLKGEIVTRIETYANKQVIFVFANIDDKFLKPYKKTIHT